MEACLVRSLNGSSYTYHLQVAAGKNLRLYRGRNYSHYVKRDGAKTSVYFNQYLFPQFSKIPMRRGTSDYGVEYWEMANEYRQTAGGASAPYEIVGAEKEEQENFTCPVCGNEVEREYGVDIKHVDGKGTVTICSICENTLLAAGII